jgi:hypothetical protein
MIKKILLALAAIAICTSSITAQQTISYSFQLPNNGDLSPATDGTPLDFACNIPGFPLAPNRLIGVRLHRTVSYRGASYDIENLATSPWLPYQYTLTRNIWWCYRPLGYTPFDQSLWLTGFNDNATTFHAFGALPANDGTSDFTGVDTHHGSYPDDPDPDTYVSQLTLYPGLNDWRCRFFSQTSPRLYLAPRLTTSVSFYGQGTFPGHWHERVNLAHFQYEPFAQIDYIYN